MRTLRTRQRFILFVLVVAVLAALVPGVGSAGHVAVLVFVGLAVPTIASVTIGRAATHSDHRAVALLSIDFFRAPPSIFSLA
jgi:hypothetical protein